MAALLGLLWFPYSEFHATRGTLLVLYATGRASSFSTSDCDGHCHAGAVLYTAAGIQKEIGKHT